MSAEKVRVSYLMLPLAESFDESEGVSVSFKFHAYHKLEAIYTQLNVVCKSVNREKAKCENFYIFLCYCTGL